MLRTSRNSSTILIVVACGAFAVRGARAEDESDVPTVRDTDRLLFMSNRAGDGKFHIYSMTADGADAQRLGKCDMQQFDPALSPDGGQIVFAGLADDAPDSSALYLMHADGSDVKRLTEPTKYQYALGPRWSPDGKQITFYVHSPGGGDDSVHLIDRDGSGLMKLAAGTLPAWSPDGEKIVYSKLGSEVRPTPPCICSLDLNTGEYRTEAKGYLLAAAFSPDGKQVAYLAESGGGQIDVFLADAAFKNPRQLTKTAATETSPRWSADGSGLYFSRVDADAPPGGDASVDVFALDLASGEERQLTEGHGINVLGPASLFVTLLFGEPMPPPM